MRRCKCPRTSRCEQNRERCDEPCREADVVEVSVPGTPHVVARWESPPTSRLGLARSIRERMMNDK